MKVIVDFLGSRRFAIFLLIITLTAILLSNLLPNFSVMKQRDIEILQKGSPKLYSVSKALQVSKIVKSPLFLVLPVFIFASITVCTVKRVNRERQRVNRGRVGEASYTVGFSGATEAVEALLRKRGWATESSINEGEVAISAFKGRNGFWGSVLFHAGMNVVLLGTLLSLITRYNGAMTLTEGYGVDVSEVFMGDVPNDFPVRSVLMEGFKATYSEGFPVDYNMNLVLSTDFEERRAHPKVNEPVSVGWYQISPSRYGYAPRFVLKKGDNIVLDGYINLVVFTPEQVDQFDVPEEGITIVTQFFPDFYKDKLTPRTRSKELKNPVSFVEVRKGGQVIGRGFLPLNKEVSFEGYSLECKDVKMWVMFQVSRDLGVPAITLGFILIATGLIIRFVWHEKSVFITAKDGMLSIGGRSRYFPALFEDELKRLAEGLKAFATEVTEGSEKDGEIDV